LVPWSAHFVPWAAHIDACFARRRRLPVAIRDSVGSRTHCVDPEDRVTSGLFEPSAYSCEMVRRVAAAERLDRTQFRSDVAYLDHVVQLAGYRCARAGVEFKGRHWWEGRSFGTARPPVLEERWHAAFDADRPLQSREWALDFNCPGCRAPVRIVYKLVSDDTKAFDWDLLEVLEAARWPER
jgi:hypothetical protein